MFGRLFSNGHLEMNSSTDGPSDLETDIRNMSLKTLSSSGYVIAGFLLSLIAFLGITSNLLVIAVLYRFRHLRTPINIMLLNLSIGDFLIAALGTPLTAAAAFDGEWRHGDILCSVYAFIMALTGIASITTLAAISVERFLMVKCAGKFVFTSRKTAFMTCGVWGYSLAVTCPPLFGWNEFVLETPNIACAPNWQSSDFYNQSYTVYLFVFGLVVPTSLILFCYTNIVLLIRKHIRNSGSGQGVSKNQNKVTVMISVVIVAFLFAWLPYASVSLVAVFGYGTTISAVGAAAPAIFAKSSIVYNPIIYVFMNPQIRLAIVSMVTCGKISVNGEIRTPPTSERPIRDKTLPKPRSKTPGGGSKIVHGQIGEMEALQPPQTHLLTAKYECNGVTSKSLPARQVSSLTVRDKGVAEPFITVC